ncbi:hypothetical protein DH26_gp135 [Chloriridovirus anopheles1]|uniref:Uncharacterized protein n=1 Tax=Chloriridovirus anopheles1 TaxID=1465751 RepID=W8QRJ9_9VIRU|nr:hypothetical protein DH26_gp135 [Anopheles minimus iridovirus]AHL67622.1 hypothetical protein AMIV_135 [Anopheles minimus iridovirus]
MDDINFEILKLIDNNVDKIHYSVAWNHVDWASKWINRLEYWEFKEVHPPALELLIPYMTVDSCNNFLDRRSDLPLSAIQKMVQTHPTSINWSAVSEQISLTNEFINIYKHNLNWFALSSNVPNLSLTLFLEHMSDNPDKAHYKWKNICEHNVTLTPQFVETNVESINWEKLCQNRHIAFPNSWWIKQLPRCGYFVFHLCFNRSQAFLEKCIHYSFNDLITNSIRSLSGNGYDHFLENVMRNLFFETFGKGQTVQAVNSFLKFAVIDQFWRQDEDEDEQFPPVTYSKKQLKKKAYYHLKKLHMLNLALDLNTDLILKMKSARKNRLYF